MAEKTKAVAVAASEEVLAQLGSAYATEEGGKGVYLPRLGMFSQDKTEETGKGKDKKIKVIAAAGEFFIERQTEEVGEDGKKVWAREELGSTIQGVIFYKRHQLRMYDEDTKEYTSSPVYDTKDEVLPLWCNKKEVARGTPAELQEKFMIVNKKGKKVSALEDNRILYVLIDGEAYQLNLRGSSMYSLLSYEKGVQPPTVITEFSSEAMENGDISWNKMMFKAVRKLTGKEAAEVAEFQGKTSEAIRLSKESYAKADESDAKADRELKELAGEAAEVGSGSKKGKHF